MILNACVYKHNDTTIDIDHFHSVCPFDQLCHSQTQHFDSEWLAVHFKRGNSPVRCLTNSYKHLTSDKHH